MRIALVYMNTDFNVGRGVGYVAGAVLQSGHELDFFDTVYTRPEKIADAVISGGYDVLMISSMTQLFPQALKLITAIRQQKNIVVLVGGIHPTIIGAELLEQHAEIDYLCIGEGESMVADFLTHLGTEDLYTVNNLAFRQHGRVHTNRVRLPEDLSKSPPFPWHLFPASSVVQKAPPFLYVTATRGCPYNCTYCCNGIYLKHYGKQYIRYRPTDQVIAELAYLKRKYNPLLFYFGDEMILAETDYARNLFDRIKSELNVPYGCMIRVEHVTPAIAGLLHKTGCRYVGMGIECGDEDFRKKRLHRFMTNAELMAGFELIKAAGIFATSFNMIGFPFEKDELLTESTIRLNQAIKPDFAQVTIFYPFPGTQLYDHCIQNDLIDPDRLAEQTRYHNESVLRGYSLGVRRDQVADLLNPHGFQFRLKSTRPKAQSGLRMRLV
ncbi:MAG: B12-binding domain-containing radical SAM protein [Desulfobacterales bacterium]|nr:B12-binding domain-containing radical SAM protein [Desulfobacterales bacterium]